MALSETKTYLTLPKIIITIASPIVVAVLWTLFKPWAGRQALMQVAAISTLVFLALWGLLFIVNLVLAPSQLDATMRSIARTANEEEQIAVGQLEAARKKDPQDERKEHHVKSCIADFKPEEIEGMRWLLDNGETMQRDVPKRFMLGIGKGCGFSPKLVMDRTEYPTSGEARYFKTNPNYEDALRNVLHPPHAIAQ
jgi:hypothetical protein